MSAASHLYAKRYLLCLDETWRDVIKMTETRAGRVRVRVLLGCTDTDTDEKDHWRSIQLNLKDTVYSVQAVRANMFGVKAFAKINRKI